MSGNSRYTKEEQNNIVQECLTYKKPLPEICLQYNISVTTFNRWKRTFLKELVNLILKKRDFSHWEYFICESAIERIEAIVYTLAMADMKALKIGDIIKAYELIIKQTKKLYKFIGPKVISEDPILTPDQIWYEMLVDCPLKIKTVKGKRLDVLEEIRKKGIPLN